MFSLLLNKFRFDGSLIYVQRVILTLLAFAGCIVSFSQSQSKYSVNPKLWNAGGFFYGRSAQEELVEKRTRISKTFMNADGTSTIYFTGPTHYKDENNYWQERNSFIEAGSANNSSHYFYNLTNEVKSYFPMTAGSTGISLAYKDMLLSFWKNPKLVFRVNNDIIYSENAAPGNAFRQGNKLIYPGIFKGMDEEVFVLENGDGVEDNLIIRQLDPTIKHLSPSAFIELHQFIPLENEYRVLREDQEMKSDFWANEFSISKDGSLERFLFHQILVFDNTILNKEEAMTILAESHKSDRANINFSDKLLKGIYKIRFVKGGIEVSVVMPYKWFLDKDRAYPVTIDPTITIGSGSSSISNLWDGYYTDTRVQALYLSSELTSAGLTNGNTITDLGIYCSANSCVANHTGLKLRMQNTALTSFPSTSFTNSGYTNVYSGSINMNATGWVNHTLSTSYTFNSAQNIILDFTMDMATYLCGSPHNSWYVWSTGANRRIPSVNGSDIGDPQALATGSGLSQTVPYLQITYSSCAVAITGQPSQSCISSGANTSFSVTASGATTYQWQRSTDNGSTWSNLSNGGLYSGVTTSVLTVTGAPGGINGYLYRCACGNGSCTTNSSSAMIGVVGGDIPTATAATGTSSSAFTANWNSVLGVSNYLLDVSTSSSFATYVSGYYNLNVGNVLTKTVTGLACGVTYYYRLRSENGCAISANSNTITVTTSACTNNSCATAASITVKSGASNSCNSPWYSTINGTSSGIIGCSGSATNESWFTFTATASTTIVDIACATNGEYTSGEIDPVFEYFTGTCGALTSAGCIDSYSSGQAEFASIATTAGVTYYARVYSYAGGTGTTGAFQICLSSPSLTANSNDASASALRLYDHDCFPRNAYNWGLYDNTGSTNASEPAAPACWTGTLNQTTWFYFIATTTTQMITTDWDHTFGGATNNRIAVYNSALTTLIGCNEDAVYTGVTQGNDYANWYVSGFCSNCYGNKNFSGMTVTGLTPGQTYYVRVDAPYGILSICTEPAPSNDACNTATAAVLNTRYWVNNTGASSTSGSTSNNTVPDLAFNCGSSGESTENMIYYTFTPSTTDVYYINQWNQYCELNLGTQFVIWNSSYDCSTLPQLTSADMTKQLLCSPNSTADRYYSYTLTGGQTYFITIDGGRGDECLFYFQITKGAPVSMPVEFLELNLSCESNQRIIQWSTASEKNNDYFIVERSLDGLHYVSLGKISGAGTTNSISTYTFLDTIGDIDSAYYRIKQLDFNGMESISQSKFLNCSITHAGLTEIRPNPADQIADVYFTMPGEIPITLELYDLLGNRIFSENSIGREGRNSRRIDISYLNKGIYLVIVSFNNESFVSKLLKK